MGCQYPIRQGTGSGSAALLPQAQTCHHVQVGDLQEFTKEYSLQCPMALQRLVASGMPATVEFGKPSGASQNNARSAAETVQYFITAMDAVKMKMAAADEVCCLLTCLDLLQQVYAVAQLLTSLYAAAVPPPQRSPTVSQQRAPCLTAVPCWLV